MGILVTISPPSKLSRAGTQVMAAQKQCHSSSHPAFPTTAPSPDIRYSTPCIPTLEELFSQPLFKCLPKRIQPRASLAPFFKMPVSSQLPSKMQHKPEARCHTHECGTQKVPLKVPKPTTSHHTPAGPTSPQLLQG